MRLRAGAFSLCLLLLFVLLAAAAGHAQSPSQPPLPGFVPPYEINRIVRSAGFSPLAPPLREGTTYVLRATDYRGILMRVVVDARSGAIRAVNRIVPAYGSLGPIGMMGSPYYGEPPYGPPPYGAPPPYRSAPGYAQPIISGPEMGPEEADLDPALGPPPPPAYVLPSPGAHPASLQTSPPLPRPRPPELAAHDPKPDARLDAKRAAKSGEAPPPRPDGKLEVKSDAAAAVPPAAGTAPAPKKPQPPTIPD